MTPTPTTYATLLSRYVYSSRIGSCWVALDEHKRLLLRNPSSLYQRERVVYGTARTCLKF